MFKRNKPHGKLQHLRELIWPSMGWWRTLKYIRYRIIRLSDSSHKIAAGLAIGTAIAFSPLLGTHFIQAGFFAWIFRVNILTALIGSFFGNPWTYPFIWWGSIKFGAYLISMLGLTTASSLPEHIDTSMLWTIIKDQPVRLFLPWMLGGHILGLISIFPSYVVFYYLVRGAKQAKTRARLRKVHKVAREVTGQRE